MRDDPQQMLRVVGSSRQITWSDRHGFALALEEGE